MNQLINYNSSEGELLKPIFQLYTIDPYIIRIVESYIYKEIINYYEDYNIFERYMTKYGLEDGKYEEFFESGIKSAEFYYKQGKLNGSWKSWHDNEQKWTICTYKDDKLEGLHQMWYSNGQKRKEMFFKDGKQDGLSKNWNENSEFIGEYKW